MDYGTLRGFFALLILALFIIIVVWAYSKRQKPSFDEAATSIFEEDENKDNAPNHKVTNKQETNNNV